MNRYMPPCVVVSWCLTVVCARAQTNDAPIDFSHAPSSFPNVLNPDKPNPIPQLDLENSPRLKDLVRGKQLVRADAAFEEQAVAVKTFISKQIDERLGAAELDVIESLPDASGAGVPSASASIARALDRRSSIRQAQLTVANQKIAEQYTRKNLLPVLSAYASLNMYGLAPGTPPALRELIRWNYPEYAFGFTWSLPVLNRAAQADDVRARLETQQSEAALQRTRQQVTLQVQNSTAGIEQNRARVRAADRALTSSRTAYEGEQQRLRAGISTPYRVLQAQRDLTAAEAADVQARVNYAKAMAAYQVAVGSLLEDSGIDSSAAERGSMWTR